MSNRAISEREFIAVENARKEELSDLIKNSGLSFSEIARETGIERRAVRRAVDGEVVRYGTALRIEYFLERYCHDQRK